MYDIAIITRVKSRMLPRNIKKKKKTPIIKLV